jgi:hypothetical protein
MVSSMEDSLVLTSTVCVLLLTLCAYSSQKYHTQAGRILVVTTQHNAEYQPSGNDNKAKPW